MIYKLEEESFVPGLIVNNVISFSEVKENED